MEYSKIEKKFRALERRQKMGAFFLLAFLVFLILYCVKVGYADTSFQNVLEACNYYITGTTEHPENIAKYKIIFLMRLPRIIMGILAGISLSISGLVMQSITRNPLVSPFTIGISNAAALGAALAIVFYTGLFAETVIMLTAFTVSCLCALLLFRLNGFLGGSATTLVLTGIALNYFFSASSSAMKYFADDRSLASIVHWTFGTFNGATWKQNLIIFVVLAIAIIPILKYQKHLEILSTSDDEYTKSLGINPKLVRSITGVSSVLLTAVLISFTGVIGFIGIISPHVARIIVGNRFKFLIPYSMLIGSILLILSDTVGRIIIKPTILPVGIVTSFIGTPLFIFLLIKTRRQKNGI